MVHGVKGFWDVKEHNPNKLSCQEPCTTHPRSVGEVFGWNDWSENQIDKGREGNHTNCDNIIPAA